MSWAYPASTIPTSAILDAERFNENLAAFAQEADGNLNEHNFTAGLLTTKVNNGLTESSVGLRLFRNFKAISPLTVFSVGDALPFTTEWSEVPDTDVTFDCPEGLLYVMVSFNWSHYLSSIALTTLPGINFVIEVDGVPQMTSLLGAGDPTNETTGDDTVDSSPSFRAEFDARVAKLSCRVGPGEHTVRLLYRNLTTVSSSTYLFQWMGQRETLVLHLWA